uniref:Uncharacterized protein n=1 Tax=viral metagenome TaxID=1070528 RepID=A0A6M3LLH5_9ZZZZ
MPTETAPLPGQGETPATAANQALADTVTGSSAPFFEDVLPDGSKRTFASKDELAKEWKNSYLRQSDYTKKTQEIASTRKQIEDERKKFADEQKAFLDNRKRYDEWDRLLKSRPDIYQQLERAATSPADPSVAYDRAKEYADGTTGKLQERLEALEKRLEEENTKKELESEMSALKEKYPDFDEPEVMARLEYLSDGKTGPLLELLHWAVKGQKSPAQIEQKITESLKKKSQAGMVSTKGAGTTTSNKAYRNTDEAREAAMRELGVTPDS